MLHATSRVCKRVSAYRTPTHLKRRDHHAGKGQECTVGTLISLCLSAELSEATCGPRLPHRPSAARRCEYSVCLFGWELDGTGARLYPPNPPAAPVAAGEVNWQHLAV